MLVTAPGSTPFAEWWPVVVERLSLPDGHVIREFWMECPVGAGQWRAEVAVPGTGDTSTFVHLSGTGGQAQFTTSENSGEVTAIRPADLLPVLDSLGSGVCSGQGLGELRTTPSRPDVTYKAGRYAVHLRSGADWIEVDEGAFLKTQSGNWEIRVSHGRKLESIWVWHPGEL